MVYWRCSKGTMDGKNVHGYLFDNAGVTESYRVEVGPLPLLAVEDRLLGAWGKEPN